MIPGRASVVRDRYGVSFTVAVPRSHDADVGNLPGAEWDHLIRRWLVPVAQEPALRTALAALDTSWSEDHRTVRRCAVCREPLAPVLVAAGDRMHLGCRLPDIQHDDEQEQLW